MIVIEDLTKNFGRIAAVAGIDLRVLKGEVLGFLGPMARQVHHHEDDRGLSQPELGPGLDLRP